MDQNTYYVYSDELYHYGRKGMKWGQNIFGKKRNASKGRVIAKKKKSLLDRAKEAQAAKKKAKEEAKAKAAEEARKRDPRNMSDAEIKRAIERKQLENKYREYYPAKVSRGKQFVSKFLDESLTPALISSGKKFLGDAFDMIGKKILDQYKPEEELTEDQKLDKKLTKLKKQHDILDYETKIKNLKNPKEKEETLSEKVTRLRNEQALSELLDTNYQDLIKRGNRASAQKNIDEARKTELDREAKERDAEAARKKALKEEHGEDAYEYNGVLIKEKKKY